MELTNQKKRKGKRKKIVYTSSGSSYCMLPSTQNLPRHTWITRGNLVCGNDAQEK